MKKATFLSITAIIGVVALFYIFSEDNTPTATPSNSTTSENSDSHHNGESSHQSGVIALNKDGIPKHLSSGVDMITHDSPSTKEVSTWNTEKDTIVWQRSEEGENILKEEGHIPGDVNNEVYLELDIKELKSVEVGEYLDLYIPQIEGSYTGEVDYITEHPNGDRTVEAHIPGAGDLFSAVITIGEKAVYGTLGTQADTYIMEGNGKYAWIASKSDLVAKHSQTHVDAIHPSKQKTTINGEDLAISLETPAKP
ncbi:hypothetical protein [Alteromonas sp. a30]|uniref:hypothetical protein n=1 Tax=Alteromonas sp. a30 TaxID=2730917 RepID=UPI00227DE955|nr:hypothetical protein [Alteromonas sp. a30]MCY7296539.1 hypothetical protein [Alteromonas sp. a30]